MAELDVLVNRQATNLPEIGQEWAVYYCFLCEGRLWGSPRCWEGGEVELLMCEHDHWRQPAPDTNLPVADLAEAVFWGGGSVVLSGKEPEVNSVSIVRRIFCSYPRRKNRRMVELNHCFCNAEGGQKDKHHATVIFDRSYGLTLLS